MVKGNFLKLFVVVLLSRGAFIYVLRMPVISLLIDKDGGIYKGVKLVFGQELFSPQLILAPSFATPTALPPVQAPESRDLSLSDAKVARGICITKKSVNTEVANCLVFPPRSLYPEQIMSVRVLQLSANVAVCPSGMFVTYLSAICDNAVEGKKLITAAINALFSIPVSGDSTDGTDNLPEHTEEKPCLLWSASYIQELTTCHRAFNSVTFTSMPDEHLHYHDLLDTTEKLFKEIYPNEEFFATNASDSQSDDGGPELEP